VNWHLDRFVCSLEVLAKNSSIAQANLMSLASSDRKFIKSSA
jgi:hypothetical protein